MQLLLRMMGYIAEANASSARQSLNMIPGNWVVIGMSGFIAVILGQIGMRDHDPLPFVFVVPLLIVSLIFLVSTLKRDTFFRVEPSSATSDTVPAQSAPLENPFGFTGRLRLHEKEAQRFINVPAHATHLESGALAFVSRIDASTRYSGVVTKSKVGLWLSVPRFESGQIECGTLFYGKTPLPALRLQFTEGAETNTPRVKAILTFDTAEHRDTMHTFLLTQIKTGFCERRTFALFRTGHLNSFFNGISSFFFHYPDFMQTPNPFDTPPSNNETAALFAANKNTNTRTMMPALGMPTVVGYRPSGRVGILAFPLAIISLLLVPPLCAWLYISLWHFGHMLLLSQILLGALAGLLLFPAIHMGKMRNPVIAGTLGVMVGAATFFGAMGWEAWQFRPQYIAGESAYVARKYHVSPQKALAATEKFYTPLNTVKFYWQDRASAGMTVTSSGGGGASHLGGGLFWVVQGSELLLVILIAVLAALQFSKRRFSEEFNRWYITKNFGAVHPLHLQPLLDTLRVGNYAHAARFNFSAKKDHPHGPQVNVAYIPEKPGGILTVSAKTNAKKGLQPVFERELNNEQMKTFWAAFPTPNATTSPFSS